MRLGTLLTPLALGSALRRRRARALCAFALGALALGCGLTEEHAPSASPTAGAADTADAADAAGAAGSPAAVALDGSNCSERPLSDCAGVVTLYGSDDNFEQTPAFAHCAAFNSYDGCGRLEFAFDAEGCAVSVSPGPIGWRADGHLNPLQACLAEALASARYPCLASTQLRYVESCMLR